MVEQFPQTPASKVITYQLLRSSSSVAANYRAVNRAKSSPDFVHKMKTVLEEADESNFWLTFVGDIDLIKSSDSELTYLINESNELTAIFHASVKTLSEKSKIKKS